MGFGPNFLTFFIHLFNNFLSSDPPLLSNLHPCSLVLPPPTIFLTYRTPTIENPHKSLDLPPMSQSSYFSNSSAPRVPVNPYAKTTKQVPRSRIRDPTNLPQKPSNLGQNSNVPPVAAGNPHFPLPPPSNHRPQQNQSSRLLKVCDAYPAIYQGIFSSKFDTFNKLQTEVSKERNKVEEQSYDMKNICELTLFRPATILTSLLAACRRSMIRLLKQTRMS